MTQILFLAISQAHQFLHWLRVLITSGLLVSPRPLAIASVRAFDLIAESGCEVFTDSLKGPPELPYA